MNPAWDFLNITSGDRDLDAIFFFQQKMNGLVC